MRTRSLLALASAQDAPGGFSPGPLRVRREPVCLPLCGEDGDRPGPVLVVESDPDLGRAIVEQLAADGYRTELALTAQHARMLAGANAPRLTVLGGFDPPRGALELLQEIRQAGSQPMPWERSLPAIVLGPQAQELDLLRAFEAGADDYMARSAPYLELRARLRAILRRTAGPGRERPIRIGPLSIDPGTRTVRIGRTDIDLRRLEFDLLLHLARDPQRVFAKDELLRAVWGYRSSGSTRTLDSHASRLRRKLEIDDDCRWVVNVWGIGYRLI
jgi:DNA-binding response OmpR family regulator